MKINSLLESQTPSSSTINTTNSSPEFGRDDEHLEETTTSGSVASVETPLGGTQRRGKGSMFAGISTSAKFPNSQAVKEEQLDEVNPHNYDSDEDYYNALKAPAKPRYRGTQSPGVNPDDEAYFREIFRKKRLAAQQAERSADHDRLATGTNESEVEEARKANTKTARKEFSNRVSSKPKLSNKEQAEKKDNSDKLWAMLQQHIADAEKNKEVDEGQQWPDSSNSLAKRRPVVTDLKGAPSKAGRGSGMTVATRVEPTITPTSVKRLGGDRPIPSFLQKEQELAEKSKSQAQFRTMAAVANNPEFAKKVGISQRVGKEFHSADKKQDYKDLPKEVDEGDVVQFPKKHKGDLEGFDDCPKCGGDLMGGKYMGHAVKVCVPCSQVYLPPNSGIDQQGNPIKEQGVAEGYPKHQDLSGVSTDKLKAYLAKQGQQQTSGEGNQVKRVRAELQRREQQVEEEKQRLDPKCWSGYKKQGTKMKGDTRVNNCVKVDEGSFDVLPQETLDLIDEYIAKIEPNADRNKLIQHVVDGSIHTSELEYAVHDDVNEGQGDFTKAIENLHGWYEVNSGNPDIKEFEFEDREGGYYAQGTVKYSMKTGRVKIEFEDRSGQYGEEDINQTFNSIGDAMNVLRQITIPIRSNNGKAQKFDRLSRREPVTPDKLRKTDRTGRKGTIGGAHSNDLKYSIQNNKGKLGPKGVLPEGEVTRTSTGLKHSGDFPDYPKEKGPEFQKDPNRLNKSETGRLDKAYGVKWEPKGKRKEISGDPTGVNEAELNETDMLAKELFKQLDLFKKGSDKDIGSKAKDKEIGDKPKDKDIVAKEGFNGEYDDEAGSAESNLLTTARAVKGLLDTIEDRDNLPEWVQEKIAKAEQMLVTSWDYLLSQKEQGHDPQIAEDWQKANKSDKTDGMSSKAVKAYRRENPGSKLQTAVTKKPSELKAGSKDAKRRKSFCARMSGNKGPMKDEKGRPTPKAKALRRWNCE